MQNNSESRTNIYIVLLLVVGIGIIVNCFFNLSSRQLQDWDEARHGISAYEMLQNGNFLINTYDYQPDYWNAKPPLSFWPVALGYKLFGFNPLGLRFFSALATCLTLFLTLLYCCKKISIRSAGFTGLVMLSLHMFFWQHNARTADPDAFFLLFNTAGLLMVLAWPIRYGAYRAASLCAGLAFLIKSFHAIPVALLLLIFFWIQFSFSRQSLKQAALCLLIALAPVALWGIARFQVDGTLFFDRMIFYDLFKRATEAAEGHDGNLFYYLKFVVNGYGIWIIVLAVGIALVLRTKRGWHGVQAILMHQDVRTLYKLALASTVPLLLYSVSASKLHWYIYPTFPFISILFGIFLDRIPTTIETQSKTLATLFIFCVCCASLIGEANTLKNIYRLSASENTVHVAMMELGSIPANRNAMVFLDTGDWRPADVLAARLYGNFQLMQGGASAYESAGDAKKRFLLSRTEKVRHEQSSQ